MQGFAGGGMQKTQGFRVQGLAGEVQRGSSGGFGEGGGGGGAALEIHRVAHQRVAGMGEVDADLVGAAGGKLT